LGIFCGHLKYFFSFGMLYQENSGNPVLAGAAARSFLLYLIILLTLQNLDQAETEGLAS
jgi:hypothetical protein